MIRHEDIDDGSLFSKPHKVWCCHCYIPCNFLFSSCRKAVSGSKKRIRQDGFDLDLAYVSPRIIVHGFPATGIEHIYRNPRLEIRRFMDTHHQNHYKMFNFCCEPGRGYDPEIYYGRVERYPFKDHHTPPLETMAAFANSAKAYLEADPLNVVNMHCKAGKGRAGLMCCVLLVRTGTAPSALAAMDLYDQERVTNRKGLTVTSQRKFVIFYEQLWRQCWGVTGNIGDITAEEETKRCIMPSQPALRLVSIEVLNLPPGLVDKYHITVHKISNFLPEKRYDSNNLVYSTGAAMAVECDTELKGNFKIFVGSKKGALGGFARLVELQHNTYFMPNNSEYVDFGVDQLDIKKKMKPKLGPDVVLRLKFDLSGASAPDSANSAGAVVATAPTSGPGYTKLSLNDEDAKSVQMVTLTSMSASNGAAPGP